MALNHLRCCINPPPNPYLTLSLLLAIIFALRAWDISIIPSQGLPTFALGTGLAGY